MAATGNIRFALYLTTIAVLLSGCIGNSAYTPLLSAEPEIGGEFTRAPRTLRLYYDALPNVSRSNVSLTGPAGEYPLRGLHTMAADDLMIEIMQPLIAGEYTVHWTTVVGDEPVVYQGSYNFSVRAN
ncbi:MAG TPA: copper resistance protein CopC [Gammaproteobacteria bacterium]|jgi:methionine-rich copper-binding protein CopC|nr:copper resistance protein CopC [Gammaproteobacteria bacterium]HIF86653.1 copper resistance protein CopC [Gammaproteobacteria bacterium]